MTSTTSTRATGTTTWQIDPAHTQAGFEVKHMMFAKVRGRFEKVEGSIILGEDGNLAGSEVEAIIESASINTGVEQRDEHLRSPDFFDVATYPTLSFRSSSVEAGKDGALKVTGDLTIRDVTREVVLQAEETGRGTDPWGNERVGFSASTTIDRREFGLKWNQALETGGILVGDEVKITLEVEAVQRNG